MRTRFTKEEKIDLVKRYYGGESVSVICLQSKVPRSTFYTWIKHYKTSQSTSGVEVSIADYMRQKERVKKLENMVEVLKTVDCTTSSPLKVKLDELTKLYEKYSVRILCESLGVARGTFYNHILRNKKTNNSYKDRRSVLSELIKEIFDEYDQVYGARKIRAILKTRGINTSDRMVAELMQSMGLYSVRDVVKKQFTKIIRDGKKDVINMNFSARTPNQVWVSDITCFKPCGKRKYICAIIDLYSRKIIAYKISQKQSTQLITATFKMAYEKRDVSNDLIFHSDRGTQYASHAFRKLLMGLNVTQSFSPTNSPYHNAVMESFFATLKKEELYRVNYRSVKEFNRRVGDYMERYNDDRPHSTLRYKTPNAYEQAFFDTYK